MERILVLGARSWVGYRLSEALQQQTPTVEVVGTSRSQPAEALGMRWETLTAASEVARLADEIGAHAIVNLLWWEGEKGIEAHRAAARWCAERGAYYCFASSALALDGYTPGTCLTEETPPRSESPYGQQKAQCESDLSAYDDLDYLIVRFASIHGWSPWKPSRTEALLQKMKAGEEVGVAEGVWQNRVLDRELAAAWADLIAARMTGVVHLGTVDSSDELSFLRKVASAFGWDPVKVSPAGVRNVNLVVTPRRLLDRFGSRYEWRESGTIEGLLECPELQPLKRA